MLSGGLGAAAPRARGRPAVTGVVMLIALRAGHAEVLKDTVITPLAFHGHLGVVVPSDDRSSRRIP